MASKTTLNAKNLEALGAERLAGLLIEVSTGNAAAKRKLRLALAGAQSPTDAAREIVKRLASIGRARSFVTWKTRKGLIADLETQRRAILQHIAPADPQEAMSLMWRFMALATPVFDRCDDSSGTVIAVFHQGCTDLGQLAEAAQPAPKALAEKVFNTLQDNGYGQYDGLIAIMAPALGEEGLADLKAMVEEFGETPAPTPPKEQRKVFAWGPNGPFHEHEMRELERRRIVSMALQDIADARGDVESFIDQYDPDARKMPKIAAEIAQRLMASGRPEDALGFIEGAQIPQDRWIPSEWQDARLESLEALGRLEDAQAFRWTCFQRSLSTTHLRAFLKRLPDFDDMEAEENAIAYAKAHPNLLEALQFFLDWPALDGAAQLLIARHDEIDGDYYEYLAPAAEVLSERHPLAATLALRAMIDFTLTQARSKRYRYAARHLEACAQLAHDIPDFGALETHEAYVERLKERHRSKSSFWAI